GFPAEGAVRRGEACAPRSVQSGRQGRRPLRRTLEHDLPGFVRTPLVEKQIPEQAKELGISEEDVIKNVMLKATLDGEFTTLADVGEVALFFAAFPSNALPGQSVIVTHGWHMP